EIIIVIIKELRRYKKHSSDKYGRQQRIIVNEIVNSHKDGYKNGERDNNKVVEFFPVIFSSDKYKQYKEVNEENCLLSADGINVKLARNGKKDQPHISIVQPQDKKQRVDNRALPFE